jgi:hypothetical protein
MLIRVGAEEVGGELPLMALKNVDCGPKSIQATLAPAGRQM